MLQFRCERAEIELPIPEFLIEKIYDLAGGVPREILKIADIAYELMQVNGEKMISPELIDAAAQEAVLV